MNSFDKLNHICPAGSEGENDQSVRFELENTHELGIDWSCGSCCNQATFDSIYAQQHGDWNIACSNTSISTGE